ncbi:MULTISPECIES: hypothetical protein [Serratia]|jgi:hypothetical protein|uniref:hypothetical protein n=1 Tax=Serratia TaxID=613 RepID=UPI0027E544C6|nr:hypothetical protein [Serratia marcescens]MCH4195241.1 hypothetical protein [Serratia liquefaciens]MCH4231451.1 hypothetical protein [Serratia liquefaciens]MCH4263144.1 hypothetical protein [Serratia liquefaciens]MCI1213179.1 hypothetical protein [Serratia liquefaciens]MCI1234536.1 hypothetical protein [Serratia liquefaciens]
MNINQIIIAIKEQLPAGLEAWQQSNGAKTTLGFIHAANPEVVAALLAELDICVEVQTPAAWENRLSGRLISCEEYERSYAGTINVEQVYFPLYR